MSLLTKKKPTRRPSKARTAETVAPATPPGRSQDELRARRRGGLPVAYGGDFGLSAEISAICTPLASRISPLADVHDERGLEMMFSTRIGDLVEAIHGVLIFGIVGWFAEIDARARIQRDGAHLDPASREAAVKSLVTLAPRPPEPTICAADIVSGRWVRVLIDLAAPYDSRLCDLMSRAYPPGDPRLRGLDSRSDKLIQLLLEVDHSARQLEHRIDKAETAAANHRTRPPTARSTRANTARDALRTMGIEVPAP